MLAKVNGDAVIEYPYGTKELKRDNPNVSFPAEITKEILVQYGVVEVKTTSAPDNYLKNYEIGGPIKRNGVWELEWIESDATEEQIQKRIDFKWQDIRDKRNNLLRDTDWTQLSDVPISTEQKNLWAEYREDLRNITSQEDPFNIIFPVAPIA